MEPCRPASLLEEFALGLLRQDDDSQTSSRKVAVEIWAHKKTAAWKVTQMSSGAKHLEFGKNVDPHKTCSLDNIETTDTGEETHFQHQLLGKAAQDMQTVKQETRPRQVDERTHR